MNPYIVLAIVMFSQSTFAHRDVSDTLKERQEIKQSMLQSLLSIKAALSAKTKDAKLLSEHALYLSKATEFSAELFPEINSQSAQFSKMYGQLIEQTARAYNLSLKDNGAQLLTQINQIDHTCKRCHSMKTRHETETHKND